MAELPSGAGQVAVAETRSSELNEVSQAIQLRHRLEKAVLDKGLVRKQDVIGPSEPGSKLNVYKAFYVVPPEVQEALRTNPDFREIYDVSSLQISMHRGGDLVEVGMWDYHNNKEGNKIVFSMVRGALPEGSGGPDIYRIALIPQDKTDPEQRYEFQERGVVGPRALSPEGTFSRYPRLKPWHFKAHYKASLSWL